MKIVLTNISETPIAYLMRVSSEKVGHIYYLKPGDTLTVTFLATHQQGLVAEDEGTVYSISYEDFPSRLDIKFAPRK